MNILETFCEYIEKHTTIPSNILYLSILSLISFFVIKLIKKIIEIISLHFEKNTKKRK